MGIRRKAAVVLAALGTLTAGASVAVATAWAAPPLHVEMSDVKCYSGAVPMVLMTFRSATNDSERISYSVTVDGEQRASGAVSGGGRSINGVTLDNGTSSRVVVTTGSTVVLDRVITGNC